jgi:hypothetical protein
MSANDLTISQVLRDPLIRQMLKADKLVRSDALQAFRHQVRPQKDPFRRFHMPNRCNDLASLNVDWS